MSVFPYRWRPIAALSLVTSYLLVSHQSHWWKLGHVGTFLCAWLVQSLAWAIWVVLLYPNLFSPLKSLPEPAGGSIWNGHFKTILAKPNGIPMREWASTVPNDGIMRYRGLLNGERVLVLGPKALSEVLVTKNYHFEKPQMMRHTLGRILGVGILLAEGDEHKLQRKNLMPAFAFRHVKDLYPVFWSKTREVVQAMTKDILAQQQQPASVDAEKAQTSAVIEVGNWASRVTLDIIGIAGLGHDFGAIVNPHSELNEMYRHVFQPNRQAQILGILGQLLPLGLVQMLPLKRNDDLNTASRYIRTVCRDLIREKKQKLAEKNNSTDHDILAIALESGGFTDEGLVDQLMTFLAAGHETTASSMTWAIYMLSRFPQVQDRLRREIRERLPSIDSDTDITSLDIDHMPYLNAVCNEVLRYYAPVPLTMREAAQDTEIQGQKIPKGTRIILSPWATHYDKDLWGADAHEFNPDRWLPTSADDKRAASGGATSNYAFMTFLHGPRSCIGQAFAKAEFACLLAGWVGRFSFELHNKEEMDEINVVVKGGVTARPAKGMYVRATVVDGW
ncbi:cytochrome P450 [Poronia punctata]|nr:cytochrome P450 [Poronia punctata]